MFAPKRSPTEPKHSKLAMKSKKAHKAHDVQPEPEPEPALSALDLPMFTTMNVQSRASPSAFASVLLSDESPIEANRREPRTKKVLAPVSIGKSRRNPKENPQAQRSTPTPWPQVVL
ncbi:hypothetical protein BC629DRAFT_1597250 [Irpex lacteus]|nr:hypothetical protein BC629DRAFT_1597250 [Irpex lacteus]